MNRQDESLVTVKGNHSILWQQPKTSFLLGQESLQIGKTNRSHLGKLMIDNVKKYRRISYEREAAHNLPC
jgi:hypothetical protein